MIWLELRITQGHRFSTQEEHEVAELVEDAIDVPARRVYCEAESNFSWCYILADERSRVGINTLSFYQMELRRAFRDKIGMNLDEISVIDPKEVARHIPEAVSSGPMHEGDAERT